MSSFPRVFPAPFGGAVGSSPGPTPPTVAPYVYRTASGEVPTGRHYITYGDERLDQVAQDVYGIQAGAVEALLVYNPGLAELASGPTLVLPAGLAILLPGLAVGEGDTRNPREVSLWS